MSVALSADRRQSTLNTNDSERLFHITDVRYLWQNEEKRLRERHARERKYIESLRQKEDEDMIQDLEDQICSGQMDILGK